MNLSQSSAPFDASLASFLGLQDTARSKKSRYRGVYKCGECPLPFSPLQKRAFWRSNRARNRACFAVRAGRKWKAQIQVSRRVIAALGEPWMTCFRCAFGSVFGR